jgi:hypothetical protein
MPLPRTCLDDRGKRVWVPSPLKRREQLDKTPRGKSLLAARETLFATPTWSLYRWPIAIAATILVWYFIRGFEYFLNFNDAPIGRFIVRASVALFAGFAIFRTLPRTYPRLASASKDLAGARICIVCLTNLDGQPVAIDNCTRCPRCGCATRLVVQQAS